MAGQSEIEISKWIDAGEGAEQLDMSEAARIFETRLASALVAEDGQLALSSLAASAAGGFMPRIQTQGQLGQARSACSPHHQHKHKHSQ